MAPTLVFDGDCGACSALARLVTRRVRREASDFDVVAYQRADLAALGLTGEQCEVALQWVASDGTVSSAQDAVASVLLAGRAWQRPLGRALRLPGVNVLAGIGYRFVARHRNRLPGGTPACSLPDSR